MEKLFLSIGLDQITGTTDWENNSTTGEIKVSGITPSVTVGFKFINDSFVIEPSVLITQIPSGDLKTSNIIGVGVTIGARF